VAQPYLVQKPLQYPHACMGGTSERGVTVPAAQTARAEYITRAARRAPAASFTFRA
jgi:hypothetical protein